jgi:hypothetical protein
LLTKGEAKAIMEMKATKKKRPRHHHLRNELDTSVCVVNKKPGYYKIKRSAVNDVKPIVKILIGVEATLGKHFEIQDWVGVRIVLATAAAHYLKGEMLWLRLIGGSGSGKTELLRAILADPDSLALESLTPAALRGGLADGSDLLARLDGKRIIMKDLAAVIFAKKDTRLELFGLLRGVKDGWLTADFGTPEGRVERKTHFDWIIATTPIIESHRQMESMLGERFVDLQFRPGHREKMAYQALVNNPKLDEIRGELAASICSLLAGAKKKAKASPPKLSIKEMRLISKWANATSLCRSPVNVDQSGVLKSIPAPEIGTRLAQDFSRVALGLKLLGVDKWRAYIQRLVWDCIPSARSAIVARLKLGPASEKSVAETTKIPLRSVQHYMQQLELLNVVKLDPTIKLKLDDIAEHPTAGRPAGVYRLNIDLPDVP